jgi:lipopolysaccharide export system protein LptC
VIALSSRSINPASVPRTPRQTGRNDAERAFRRAAQHSRLVRILRYGIPAIMIVVAFVIFVETFLNPFRLIAAFPIESSKISLSGTKIVMELPRVNGFTTDSRPYALIARTATQDVAKPDILELNEIDAQIELKDGQHVTIKSINGIYDTKGDVLKLRDRVVIHSSSGYEGHLSEATIAVATGNVVSESPVEVMLPNNGLLNADRLEVEQNGALIVFGGAVEMTLNPDPLRPASQEAVSSGAAAQTSVQHPPAQSVRDLSRTRRSSGSKQRVM